MTPTFTSAPRRCTDLVCRRSGVCRRPFASACLTSPDNIAVRRQRLVETLRRCLRESGTDPDGPPPPNALPIEETLAIILEEARRRGTRRGIRGPGVVPSGSGQ